MNQWHHTNDSGSKNEQVVSSLTTVLWNWANRWQRYICGQQLVKSASLQWPHRRYFISPFDFPKSCCTIVNSLCITFFSITLFVLSISSGKLSLSLSHWGHSEKAAIFKPERELSPGTEFVGTLILDISASKTVRNKCFLFKPPCSWYFVIAAWTD